MRDLLSSCESGGRLGPETRRHVSNFTRSINATRLSGSKPPSSTWSRFNLVDHLQICKGLKWQHPTATVLTTTTMHRYNTANSTTNMTFDEEAANSYFGGMDAVADASATDAANQADRNNNSNKNNNNNNNNNNRAMQANQFTGTALDPSAAFPGLGELPSEDAGEGTFTGDLNMNASVYDQVGEDHTQLLHDMLQQQQQQQAGTNNNQSGQASQQGGGASASAWEDSLHVLQEMLLLQQQQQAQQIYQSQAEQVFSHAYTSTPHDRGGSNHQSSAPGYNNNNNNNNNNNKTSSTLFAGESELLSLLQLPRTASVPGSGFYSALGSHRGKGPLYSTSTIAGPVNTGEFFEARLGLSHGDRLLHHHGAAAAATQTAASFFHTLPRHNSDLTGLTNSLLSRPSPILLDLDPDRLVDAGGGEPVDGATHKASTTSPFALKRPDHHGVGALMGSAGGKAGEPRGVNHFATERQRREFLNEKYQTLRSLVPNPTKADRASIVADAIEYVKELKRTVQELQLMVQEKRRTAGALTGRKRSHRAMELPADPSIAAAGAGSHQQQLPCDLAAADTASNCNNNNTNNNNTGSGSSQAQGLVFMQSKVGHDADGAHLRSSWLQRTSQSGTQVDVRIVHDEVTIKLTQRRRRTCLLLDAFGVLQELSLDVVVVSGASVGEHDVFLFNTKILEGSSTFAGYIAAKMLDAVDHRPQM